LRDGSDKGPLRDLKTGTGFACAKLSEILPCARVARFGQDDKTVVGLLAWVRSQTSGY